MNPRLNVLASEIESAFRVVNEASVTERVSVPAPPSKVSNEEILASDYSYGQIYFEITGENKNHYLSKLTHFDLRAKKFPVSTMAQTLIARIDCSIYHLQDKYLVTCNSSFDDYFKDRLQDAIDL